MISEIEVAAATIWHLLPQFTATVEFCSALIGLIVTMPLLVRRIRRWRRRRR